MLEGWVILPASLAYVCLLFWIAHYVDKRAEAGRSVIRSPYIYALSVAVYCTSWTFYGSVGRAASTGVDFLTIYLGPTLTFVLWWFLLRKVLRISKAHRITSIADFISSRYGKSTLLGGLVTVIAVIGIMPYIALQLKAVSISFGLLMEYPEVQMPPGGPSVPFVGDTAFLVAIGMTAFAILFGTRHIDASEHHEGMVAAIAFESIVKLVAFIAVGVFVTYGLYDGVGDIFAQARALPQAEDLFRIRPDAYAQWISLTVLSMAAVLCLPRQFQVAIVENVDEDHLRKAAWLFPLYLVLINLFVLPIAVAGLLTFGGSGIEPDTFVLSLPMAAGQELLTLFAYIGGLSAATAMVIVATIALSTMVCNDLVMPVLLRTRWLRLNERGDLTALLLAIRRGGMVGIVLMGYVYYRSIGESVALVSIGLVSFAAAAQFAPAIVGGIFWKGATNRGAMGGLALGFLVWAYTLLLPSFARSGRLPETFIDSGPMGIELLRPYALLGLTGLDHISHAVFWSMLANIGGYVGLSLTRRPNVIERTQAAMFVDVFRWSGERDSRLWRGSATVADLQTLLVRFLGRKRTERALQDYARRRGLELKAHHQADPGLVGFAERLLAGAIGAASARVMVETVVKAEFVGLEEVMEILDETSHVIEYSRQLEEKSQALERATAELRQANERLTELDRLKDDFLSTVSHELRTPLTSIRSFSEILRDTPEIEREQRERFLDIIASESERLTRLINQILDLAKMEAGRFEWQMQAVDPLDAIEEAVAATGGLFSSSRVRLERDLPRTLPLVHADRDRLIQVMVNLLSNANNVCEPDRGVVRVWARAENGGIAVGVCDNGPGLPREAQKRIFEKFQRETLLSTGRSVGTGLGLSICRQIVEHFGGRIWVASRPGEGADFAFSLPVSAEAEAGRASAGRITRLIPGVQAAGRRLRLGRQRRRTPE